MILEPRKSAEEIERRLSALTDPELAELLKGLNEGLSDHDLESYTSPYAPAWKRHVGMLALAGLFAMSAGYGFVAFQPKHNAAPQPKAHTAIAPPVAQKKSAAVPRRVAKHRAAPAPVAYHRVAPVHAVTVTPVAAPAPNEALIRQARAQLIHERAVAAAAQAQAARAQHQAKLAMQAQAAAQARAQADAQARAQAEAQARAEATARAQAEAQTQAQSEAQAQSRADTLAREAAEQDWVRANASGPGTKSIIVPPDTGRLGTNPSHGMPLPMPGPGDPNCTPHRASFFGAVVTSALIGHVRVGNTNVSNIVHLVHP